MIRTTSDITVRLIQKMGGDQMVVASAKVSTTGEDALRFAAPEYAGSNAGLINYLVKQRHGTPFEHAALTSFVHAPAFVWWEWTRHRIGHSFNIESSRYKKLEPLFWVPRRDRNFLKPEGFKPSRPGGFLPCSDEEYELTVADLAEAYRVAYEKYEAMLGRGVASEVARAALGFAVYFSGWVTVNPRSLMAFLSLRTHEPDATFVSYPQAEIEEAARVTERLLADGWPLTYKSFCDNGRVGP